MPHLNVAKVRNARHPGGDKTIPVRLADGAGLYLQVATTNAKSWVFRFKRGGKEAWMGLGSADADGRMGLSLVQARDAVADARKLLRAGTDPIAERQRSRTEMRLTEQRSQEQTFQKAAEAYIDGHRQSWKSGKHEKQWRATLKAHVFDALGDRHVAEITTNDVVEVLKPIWSTIPETASRVRQRIETILDFAAAPSRRWRSSENPARWRGVVEYDLPKRPRHQRHQPSLSQHDVNAFVADLPKHDGMAALALKFAILTACRSGEVLGAIWSEIDVVNAVWTIPAKRMKAGRPHRIPLSPPALDVLQQVKKAMPGWSGSLVFPSSQSGKRMSDMALSQLVRGMATDGLGEDDLPRWRDDENRAVVPHGFRATFKSWARSSGIEDHLSEIALAHVDKDKTRAAYAREDLLNERRPMMEAWARHCTAPKASVTNIMHVRNR